MIFVQLLPGEHIPVVRADVLILKKKKKKKKEKM